MPMNHPPPMLERNYRKIGVKFNEGVKVVAGDIMQDACHEIRSGSCDVVDTGVSVEGTWQKRGFTSYNGVVVMVVYKLRHLKQKTLVHMKNIAMTMIAP